jgi:stage IV sporulation protein FB
MFGTVHPSGRAQLRLFGIPIRVEPVFLLIVVLLGLGPSFDATLLIGWVVVVIVSILVHELGHAFAFLAFGSRPSIVLYGLGGVTSARAPERRWQSVIVSLAGPLLPFVLMGIPAIVLSGTDWAAATDHREVLVRMVVWVNVWWGLVNLLPLLPLDGGHVAEQFVGARAARVLTIAVAVPIGIYALSEDLPFAAVLALLCGYQAWQQLRHARDGVPRSALGGPTADPWTVGVRLIGAGQRDAAVTAFVRAALAGPPSPPVLEVLVAARIVPDVVKLLLAQPGDRPPVAAAETASGLRAAGRREEGMQVAALLAADPRSPALQEWAESQLGRPPS